MIILQIAAGILLAFFGFAILSGVLAVIAQIVTAFDKANDIKIIEKRMKK